MIRKFIKNDEGQDLIEYSLLLVFLALAAISILPILGQAINNVFSQSNCALKGGMAS